MTKRIHQDYFKRETAEVAQFVDSLKDNATKGGTFDSAAAADFLATATSQNTGVKVPDTLQTVLDEAKGDDAAALVTRAVLDGVSVYEAQHGTPAPADVIELALHSAYATTEAARRKFSLDSATSAHHDQISLQPNRAVVAILAALGEAIPFAHYLPADIGSNEARLAIMTHQAGNTFGSYAQGALLDGVAAAPLLELGRVLLLAAVSTVWLLRAESEGGWDHAAAMAMAAANALSGASLAWDRGWLRARSDDKVS